MTTKTASICQCTHALLDHNEVTAICDHDGCACEGYDPTVVEDITDRVRQQEQDHICERIGHKLETGICARCGRTI